MSNVSGLNNYRFSGSKFRFIKDICLYLFGKTYLQKPHCITTENILSNKMQQQLQLRFVLENKDLKKQLVWVISAHAALP